VFEIKIEKAAEKQLKRVSSEMHDRIVKAILPLAYNPRPVGSKKLSGSVGDWRIRVGDYRVAHRRDVYQ